MTLSELEPRHNSISYTFQNKPCEKLKTNKNIITNISTRKLSAIEERLLNKGLTFVPTPCKSQTLNQLLPSLEILFQKMATIYYFQDQPKSHKQLYLKTNWIPPIPKNNNLLKYFELTYQSLVKYKDSIKNYNLKNNLQEIEIESLKRLQKDKTIIIKKADKGSSIVLMDKQTYIEKVQTHLTDEKSYIKLPNDASYKEAKCTIEYVLEFLLKQHKIDENTYRYLIPKQNLRISQFYILPKIHKQNIPGRPIVSSINSLTENISRFLSHCISPLTNKLQSYIKDTKHFLTQILTKKTLSKNSILLTIDVTSLYTNIPHNEGIDACLHYIEKYRNELPSFTPNNSTLKTLFKFVLENNYFEFDNVIYKQLFGTAMGTVCAPNYANLFLGYLEENTILKSSYKKWIKTYLRFLDDIFMIWQGTRGSLKPFLEYINSIHPTIKFTYQCSDTTINFLDTTIYIHPKKRILQSKLFTKPTDTKTLLHYNSYHPNHTKRSVIYSQALRYRTITSENSVFKKELQSLKETLTTKGLPYNNNQS